MSHYGALSPDPETAGLLTLGEHRIAERHSQRKLSAAVAVASMILFFAGRHVESGTRTYTMAEVVEMSERCEGGGPRVCMTADGATTDRFCDTAADCQSNETCPNTGKFIGGCVSCKECNSNEYANGGCTAFKDTHCSFCTPIANCERGNTNCTNVTDSTCSDCNRPESGRITDYEQIEIGYFRAHKMERSDFPELGNTFAAYWGPDCRPCSVCDVGYWQEAPCTQDKDTMCLPCTVCEAHYGEDNNSGQYTVKTCSYFADSECADCDYCEEPQFTTARCTAGDPYTLGSNAVCQECATCDETQFVEKACVPQGVSRVEVFDDAEPPNVVDVYYVENEDDPHSPGSDTVCSACSTCAPPTLKEVTAYSGFYFNNEWVDKDPYSFHVSVAGEYIKEDCVRGNGGHFGPGGTGEAGHDTVCEACPNPFVQSGCRLNAEEDGLYAPPGGLPRMEGCQYWQEEQCGMANYVAGEDLVPVALGGDGRATAREMIANGLLSADDLFTANSRITGPGKWHACTECGLSDFASAECTVPEDSVCTACANVADIDFCPVDNHHCDDPNDVRCSYDPATLGERGIDADWCGDADGNGDGFEEAQWCTLDACDVGFYGPQCGYLGMMADCVDPKDGVGKYFLERTAKKGRQWFDEGGAWTGKGARDPHDPMTIWFPSPDSRSLQTWTVWCMELCNQYDNCTAFSVEDNGTSHFAHGDPDQTIKPETQCRLYEETNVTSGDDVTRDCYIRWRKNDLSPRDIVGSNEHVQREYNALEPEVIASLKEQDALGQVMKMWEGIITEQDEHGCVSATQEWCEVLGRCIESKTERCLHEKTVLDTMSPERMACHMRNFEKAYQPPEGTEKFMFYTWRTGLSEAPKDSQYHTGGDDGFATKEESIAAAITFQFNDTGAYRHPILPGDNWFYCLLNHKCVNMSTDAFAATDSVKIFNPNLGQLGPTKTYQQLTNIVGAPALVGNPDYFCADEQTIFLPWGGWDSVFLTAAQLDPRGCDRSRGESWCEATESCMKKWAPENESKCPGESGVWQEIEEARKAEEEKKNNLDHILKDSVVRGMFQYV